MLHDLYLSIYGLPYGILGIIAAALLAFAVLAHLFFNKHTKLIIGILGTAIACAFILFATVLGRSEGQREFVIPFYSFIRALESSEYLRMVILNIFLFMPYGVFMTLVFCRCRMWKNVLITLITGAVISVLIEASQYIFGFGCTEVDDVLCNELGTIIGIIPYLIVYPFVYKKNISERQDQL